MAARHFLHSLEEGFGQCDVLFGWDIAEVVLPNLKFSNWERGFADIVMKPDLSTFALVPLEHLLARLNLLPVPLLDTPLAPGIGKMLVTACELGVFDALCERPLSLEALAERLKCNSQGLQLLLQLLVSSGYLRRKHGHYRNSRVAQRWLTSNSPVSIAPYVMHSPDIVSIWDHLPEVIRENKQVMRMPYDEDPSNPETREALARHYAGLASLAMTLGGEIVSRPRVGLAARSSTSQHLQANHGGRP